MIRRGRTSGTLSDYVDEKVAAWKGGTVGSSKEGSECSVCVGGGGGYQHKLAEVETPSTHTFMKQLLKSKFPGPRCFLSPSSL